MTELDSPHELRFHRELYAGEAVDAAVQAFGRFAAFELQETAEHWIVRFTPRRPELARRIAGELGNHALGLTVQRGGAK